MWYIHDIHGVIHHFGIGSIGTHSKRTGVVCYIKLKHVIAVGYTDVYLLYVYMSYVYTDTEYIRIILI